MSTTKFNELKNLLTEVESDYTKFNEKGFKAAVVRIRISMKVFKKLAQEIRVEVSQKKSKEV